MKNFIIIYVTKDAYKEDDSLEQRKQKFLTAFENGSYEWHSSSLLKKPSKEDALKFLLKKQWGQLPDNSMPL